MKFHVTKLKIHFWITAPLYGSLVFLGRCLYSKDYVYLVFYTSLWIPLFWFIFLFTLLQTLHAHYLNFSENNKNYFTLNMVFVWCQSTLHVKSIHQWRRNPGWALAGPAYKVKPWGSLSKSPYKSPPYPKYFMAGTCSSLEIC